MYLTGLHLCAHFSRLRLRLGGLFPAEPFDVLVYKCANAGMLCIFIVRINHDAVHGFTICIYAVYQ